MSVVTPAEKTYPGSQPPSALRIALRQPVAAGRLLGRGDERLALDGLLSSARAGRSGALIIRGEPGIGKSALLGYAAQSAAGFGVAQSCGVE
jgi:AAA ATPase domain